MRERLPNRRASESFAFIWNGMDFTATVSRFADGRPTEIFLSNGKIGSDADAAARDSAVVCSLALQFGAPVETIRRAMVRDAHGVAASPLGRALDLFVGSAP
jgi:ribonucleoside-diphosphate reductase alpha chain